MTHPSSPMIAIACGGTGGHLFPGLAVAEQLLKRGCAVTLLVSPKEVDQQAVKAALERRSPTRREEGNPDQRAGSETGVPVRVVTLPAVGLQNRNYFSFAASFVRSYFAARKAFRDSPPVGALAMGGFTSAPPICAAKNMGAKTFLHESNTVPGRANRWLSRFVVQCFVGFPQAAERLRNRNVTITGTPVRPQFLPRDPASCRVALGLAPDVSTILVMGGSQGASGVNELIMNSLGLLASEQARVQFLHLTGHGDAEKVRGAYAKAGLCASLHPFLAEMDLALGAATVAVSRSGASSLAELAAVRVPSVLIPFPAATDNHQYFNARAFEETGAARLLEQKTATPETLVRLMLELIDNTGVRDRMQAAVAKWHTPRAAEQIAETMLQVTAENEHAGIRSHNARNSCNSGEKHRAELRAKTAA